MVDEDKERNGGCEMGKESKGKGVGNGSLSELENVVGNSGGSSGDFPRMYSRRKRQKMSGSSEEKVVEDGKVSMNSASNQMDKVCVIVYSFVVFFSFLVYVSSRIWFWIYKLVNIGMIFRSLMGSLMVLYRPSRLILNIN